MRLVRAGKVEILLCASLSGLGRSVPELLQVLREFVGVLAFLRSIGTPELAARLADHIAAGLTDEEAAALEAYQRTARRRSGHGKRKPRRFPRPLPGCIKEAVCALKLSEIVTTGVGTIPIYLTR